jgi:hypothetical protein
MNGFAMGHPRERLSCRKIAQALAERQTKRQVLR